MKHFLGQVQQRFIPCGVVLYFHFLLQFGLVSFYFWNTGATGHLVAPDDGFHIPAA